MMAMYVSANQAYVKILHNFMLQKKMAAKDHVLDPVPQTWLEICHVVLSAMFPLIGLDNELTPPQE